ncbi:MAG TPA: DUF397 domain-containing protein [Actinophytocola sp.]|uniref:DUF397 domain-containing protein n=1 Tax=Actinophytocola sp. TaxID=1872138 RepID=UPI002E0701E7|nr:DUF397 domain-containing protein [Actinophytocola sp.]
MFVDNRSTTQEWIRASRCGPKANTNCVELRLGPDGLVAVRDSKSGDDVLLFDTAPWAAFLAHCQSI